MAPAASRGSVRRRPSGRAPWRRGLEHGGHVVGVGTAAWLPSWVTDMSTESMRATMPLATAAGSMSGRTGAGGLPGAEQLGARLAELVERGHLEHADGDLGLEAGQEAAGQRMALHRRHQGEDQGVVPAADVGHVRHREPGPLRSRRPRPRRRRRGTGPPCWGSRRRRPCRPPRRPGRCRRPRWAVAVPAEPSDGGLQDGPPRLGALWSCRPTPGRLTIPLRYLLSKNRGFERISQII